MSNIKYIIIQALHDICTCIATGCVIVTDLRARYNGLELLILTHVMPCTVALLTNYTLQTGTLLVLYVTWFIDMNINHTAAETICSHVFTSHFLPCWSSFKAYNVNMDALPITSNFSIILLNKNY